MIKKTVSVFITMLFIFAFLISTSITTFARTTLKITKLPTSVTVAAGQVAKTTVKVKGDGVKYTWYYKNPKDTKFKKSAIKTNTYSVEMTSSRNGRKVYCKITDKYGAKVQTETVTLSQGKTLKITKQPKAVTVPSGDTAKTTISASGTGVKYTWYYKNPKGTKFKKSAIKTNTYSIEMISSRSGRQVYCIVSDKYGVKVKSKTVSLSQGATLKITKQPESVTVDRNQMAETSVTASGDGVKYTWYYKNPGDTKFKKSAITTNVYSFEMTPIRDGRRVYCVITDKYGRMLISKEAVFSETLVIPDESIVGGKTWSEVLETMPKHLKGTKVIMYNWNVPSEYTGAPKAMEEFRQQTGINVEWRTVNYSQYFTKLPALIAAGQDVPDVARCKGPEPTFMRNFQPINKIGYDFSDAAWDKGLMDLYTYGDNTYAASLKNTHIGTVNLIFYNRELITKYGFEDPYALWKSGKWTWDKYIKMCNVYSAKTGMPGSCGEGHFRFYATAFGLKGAVAYNGKNFYNAMNEQKFLTTHQLLGDLYNRDGLFAFGSESGFNNGKILFSIGSSIHLKNKSPYFQNLKATNNLAVVPVPKIGGQDTYYQGVGEAEAYGIPKGANNPQAVPYFLRYFLDGENYDLSTFFGDKQNLEVYNWCQRQNNKVFAFGYPSAMWEGDLYSIEKQTGAEMKSFINSNMGMVDALVKEYNNMLVELSR